MIAAAAVVWIGTDGQFHISNHAYFESAKERAESLEEDGLSVSVIYRSDFIEKVAGSDA